MSLYTIARFIVLLRLSFCLFYVDNRLLHSFPTRRSSDLFAYTEPLRLLPAPEGAAAAPFQAMLASARREREAMEPDRKSTRLNSSHLGSSYAVFCLKKKNNKQTN